MNINRSDKAFWSAVMILFMASGFLFSCGNSDKSNKAAVAKAPADSTVRHQLPDTLRVATLYSPASYFIYRDTPMGYDYELITQFGSDKGVAIDLHVASSMTAMIEMLDSGLVDLIAYEVPVTAEYKAHIIPCGPETITNQVLVQPKNPKDGAQLITDVTQLVGREVYVEADSKYHYRLKNLNEELGGGIIIKPIDRDTLITEQLIAMVSDGEIPLTVVDSDIASVNRTYFTDLDITLALSFPQRAAWGVALDSRWLADSVNAWLHQEKPAQKQLELLKRYFEESKISPTVDMNFQNGRMSPYDNLFRELARPINWDWRLLSAMGFTESHYDNSVVSWAGARGIMQIMPATARAYGLSEDRFTDNHDNIATAVKIIADLDKTFARHVSDPEERKKFIVAAYNSGPAHILDAIALAKKHGLDSQKWIGQVEQAMMMKSKPEYYNDPVCKYGYFNGRQTYDYVHKVYECYAVALKKVPL